MIKQDMSYIDGINEIKELDKDFFYSCVGKGWKPFVEEFLKLIEENNGIVHQIKEKFGHLRLYSNLDSDLKFNKKVREIEDRAAGFCEKCGSIGTTVKVKSWYKTLCLSCEDSANVFNG